MSNNMHITQRFPVNSVPEWEYSTAHKSM